MYFIQIEEPLNGGFKRSWPGFYEVYEYVPHLLTLSKFMFPCSFSHVVCCYFACACSEKDLELAKHIAYVHQHSAQPPSEIRALPMRLVRRYVGLTKRKHPFVPQNLADYIVCKFLIST